MVSSEHFVNFPLGGFSPVVFALSNLADTSKTGEWAQSWLNQSQQLTANNTLFDTKLRHIPSRELQWVLLMDAEGDLMLKEI